MRRRQIYEAKRAAPVVALSVSEPPMGPVADWSFASFGEKPVAVNVVSKHACPHCGKVYPRGLHLHVNRCRKRAA